jgi:CelD/BcsL family acetyltransferase involved in cellulose biosynthesis
MPGTTAKSDPRLVQLDPTTAERWDRFVDQHPDSTAYHLSAWGEILQRSYRFEPMYLALEGPGGEISGILPLVYGRGPLSGARVVSLPARIQVAGPLGRSSDVEVALLGAACEIVRSGKASRLQLRSRREGYEHVLPDLAARRAWPTWRMELPSDPDAFWERFTGRSKSLRRNVRKAQRSGVSVREGSSSGDLRRFYRLYLKTMRKHRELPRSLRQLTVSKRLLGPPGVFKLFVAEYDGRVIAGGVFHFFRDTVELLYNASDDRYLDVRPNHAIYWDVIRIAIAAGFRFFDFGVAQPGSSLADFKRRWSAEPLARFYYSYPAPDAGSGTDRNRSEQALKIRRQLRRRDRTLLHHAWRRAPLALTRLGGVLVYRYL